MKQPQTYKDRTVEVRNTARAHLRELRQERIRKRNASTVSGDVNRPERAAGIKDDIAGFQEPAEVQDVAADLTTPGAERDQGSKASEEAPDAFKDELHDLAVENVAMSEMGDDIGSQTSTPELPQEPSILQSGTDVQTSEPTLNETDVRATETGASDGLASDLETLPGAGPGLVWMLNQCGIQSLADLARVTPDQLSKDLGVVGQILDVSQWVAFAKKE